uniref:TLC domain-containing protein n=1 Tax=viral metagenome TaxID=1070528 RepID=A0A6C0J0F3_9ZZZZ
MFLIKNITNIFLYLINSLFVNYLYDLLRIIFNNVYNNYKIITPKHKQIYFISNIIKGSILGLFSPIALRILYSFIFKDIWEVELIKFFANIYVSLDLVSMFKVEKMQINTTIHHIMVQVLYLFSLIVCDFGEKTIAKPIVIYAIFSTFSFVVNLYLSLRLTLKEKYLKKIATIASILYQICCLFNWLYQGYYLYTENIYIIYKLIYTFIILSIVNDDIVLINFLNKNSNLIE